MPYPLTASADDIDIRPHPTRPGYVIYSVDTPDGHFECDMTIAALDDLIATLRGLRRLLKD